MKRRDFLKRAAATAAATGPFLGSVRGVIACRTGRKIRWDAKQEKIVGDPEAQRMTSKQYRAPWLLPKV